MIGIYCIRNILDNKRYVGQSVRVQIRKYEHFEALAKGVHHNPHLQAAYNLYGKQNFVFEVLEECDASILSQREVYWVAKYGESSSSGVYNITPGGKSNHGENNPRYGKHWSDEWKQRQSLRMKAYLSDPTHHPLYGKHFSADSRAKMSKSRKGRVRSEEARQKTSDTLKRKYATGELVSPMKGKHHTEETKQKLRNRIPYRHTEEHKQWLSVRMSGEYNPMKGKHHTESAKQAMSEHRRKENNGMYGMVHINNGVVHALIPKGSPLPEGFVLGMLPRKKRDNL